MGDLLPGVPKKEIRDISVKRADNNNGEGYVLRYCIYTPSGLNSESSWDDKTLVYTDKEQLFKDLSALLDETLI